MDKESNPSLRKLKAYETCSVERKYSVDKNFNFFGSSKIESTNDVAFIFKKLQTASVENVFIVYERENDKPIIQHMSMGDNKSSIVYFNALRDGINRFGASKVHMIHNHPSGNLTPSDTDFVLLKKMKESFGDIIQDGIIINTISGDYSVFSTTSHYINEIPKKHHEYQLNDGIMEKVEQTKHTIYKFDKLEFKQNQQLLPLIVTSKDIAKYISKQRLSPQKKISALILDRQNRITANLHLTSGYLNSENKQEITNELSSYAARFGGSVIVLYGNLMDNVNDKLSNFESKYDAELRDNIKEIKSSLSKEDITILDVIHINHVPVIDINYDIQYKSAADEGLLEPEVEYKTLGKQRDWVGLSGADSVKIENICGDSYVFASKEACNNIANNLETSNEINVGFSPTFNSWYFVEYKEELDKSFLNEPSSQYNSIDDETKKLLSKIPAALSKNDFWLYETSENAKVIQEAQSKGFVQLTSHTQAEWTTKGAELYKSMIEVNNPYEWRKDFPDVLAQSNGNTLKKHDSYYAGKKSHDYPSAQKVVQDLIKKDKIDSLKKYGKDAIIVPIISENNKGVNLLPYLYAFEISKQNNQTLEDRIYKNTDVNHTNSTGIERLINPPTFSGEVQKGKNYILVDDLVSSGSTLKALKEHIEVNGGKVVHTTALACTSTPAIGYSGYLAIKPETIEKLQEKFNTNDLNLILNKYEISKSINGLTNQQGNYIAKFNSLDVFESRINEARNIQSTNMVRTDIRESKDGKGFEVEI